MCEGGKFQKAAAAKEELGETDAPPSYGGGAHQKHERGCSGVQRLLQTNSCQYSRHVSCDSLKTKCVQVLQS